MTNSKNLSEALQEVSNQAPRLDQQLAKDDLNNLLKTATKKLQETPQQNRNQVDELALKAMHKLLEKSNSSFNVDLVSRAYDIAKQVHSRLNIGIDVLIIPYSSHLKIWWKCSKGFDHVWQAKINTRTSINSGCPICSGHKVIKSNSLSYVYPEIAIEWDYDKNEMGPDNIYCRSTKSAWWKCQEGDDHK